MPVFRFKTKEEKDFESAEISWQVAQPLIAAYATRPDALQVVLPNGDVETLKALRFSVADIQRLINLQNVTDIYLMFATSPTNPQNITIIAGGVADGQQTGGMLDTSLLYDYCEPCPSKCAMNVNKMEK